jgi:hypothetical protein
MKGRLRPILAAAALFCAPLAWSQSNFPYSAPGASSDQQQSDSTDQSQSDQSQGSSGDQSQSGVGGPQATFSHPESIPPLNLFGDVVKNTGVTFNAGLGFTSQHWTGGFGGASGQWPQYYSADAGVTVLQVRPTLMWSLGYDGGVNTLTGYGSGAYSILDQNARANIIWSFAPRWQLRVKDNYSYSDDPFQPFFSYIGNPTPNNPNPAIYAPSEVVEQNRGEVDLTYVLGAHDTLNFSGGESFQHFLRGFGGSLIPNEPSLWNSTTYSGGGFYQHDVSARLSVGGGYTFQALDFGHGQSRAGINMLQAFGSYKITRTLLISAWAGPEFTNSKDLVPIYCLPSGCLIEVQHNSYLDAAEGGNIRWQATQNNAFGVMFTHSVTNGGGLFGAVTGYQAAATYSRSLARKWILSVGFLYVDSVSLIPLGTTTSKSFLRSDSGSIGVHHPINNSWRVSAYYAYARQSSNYYSFSGLPINGTTSGLGLNLQYVWNHSLGR